MITIDLEVYYFSTIFEIKRLFYFQKIYTHSFFDLSVVKTLYHFQRFFFEIKKQDIVGKNYYSLRL